jgi:hypothetical protein
MFMLGIMSTIYMSIHDFTYFPIRSSITLSQTLAAFHEITKSINQYMSV